MKKFLMAIMVTAGLTVTAHAFNEAGCARVGQELKMKVAELEAKEKKEKNPAKKTELANEINAVKAKHEAAKAAMTAKKYKECVAIR